MPLPPDHPVPAPPKELAVAETLPAVLDLRAAALAQRPDLQALAGRLAADQAALALAYKDYYPDVEVMAAYDAFWQGVDRPLQGPARLPLDLPVPKAPPRR